MQIVSSYVDYYDYLADGTGKKPVYNRLDVFEPDCYGEYATALQVANIAGPYYKLEPVILCPGTKIVISIKPYLVGIGGTLHFYVRYKHSLLNLDIICRTYDDLQKYYKNYLFEKAFSNYEKGKLATYAYNQFKCVNFVMWGTESGKVTMVKEPPLLPLPRFLSDKETYDAIRYFLLHKREFNDLYKIKTRALKNHVDTLARYHKQRNEAKQ